MEKREGLDSNLPKKENYSLEKKFKTNYNDDDDSNLVNFNKNGEEVDEIEESILDNSDNTTSDNIEDAKDDKDYNDVIPKNACIKCCLCSTFFKDKYECI